MDLVAVLSIGVIGGYFLTFICRNLSRRLKFEDHPGGHKHHDNPIPLLGGLAVAGVFWIGLGILIFLGRVPLVEPITGTVLGSILIVLVGLVDDKYELDPYTKLAGQVLAALILVVSGLSLSLFLGQNLFTQGLTILWIVLVTNSFNLLDNMNGLCGGVGAICSCMFALVAAYQGQQYLVLTFVLLAAALVGFLRHNAGDASVFLGDAGSGFVGFVLAALSVQTTFAAEAYLEKLAIIVPIIIFAVPFYDTITVVLYRWRNDEPIFKPDNRHFSHRLTRMGMSEDQAVGLIGLLTLSTGMLGAMIPRVDLLPAIVILLHTALVLAVILLLEQASRNELLTVND